MRNEPLSLSQNSYAATAANTNTPYGVADAQQDGTLVQCNVLSTSLPASSPDQWLQAHDDSLHHNKWRTNPAQLSPLRPVPNFPTRGLVVNVPPMSTCPGRDEETRRNHQFACNAIVRYDYVGAVRELKRLTRDGGSGETLYDLAGATLCLTDEAPSPRQRRDLFNAAFKGLENRIIQARESKNYPILKLTWDRYVYCLQAVIWAWEDEIAQSTDATEQERQTKALFAHRSEVEAWYKMIEFHNTLNNTSTLQLGEALNLCPPMSLALVEDLDLANKSLQYQDILVLLKALNEALKAVPEPVLPLRRLNLSENKLGNAGIKALSNWVSKNASNLPDLSLVEVANNGADVTTEEEFAQVVLASQKFLAVDVQLDRTTDPRRYVRAQRRVSPSVLAQAELAPWMPLVDDAGISL